MNASKDVFRRDAAAFGFAKDEGTMQKMVK